MVENAKPLVGVTTSFTGKYKASKLLYRFLELMNVSLVKSTRTTPAIIEAGTTLASAEFCLPLRVYVGHMYQLVNEHPNLDFLLTPIIKGEYPSSSTCAKYQDLNGVLIRSLGSITGYHIKTNKKQKLDSLQHLIGHDTTKILTTKVEKLPKVIAPEIESLDKNHLRNVCKKVYAELMGLNKAHTLKLILESETIFKKKVMLTTSELIYEAFEQAYKEIITEDGKNYKRFLQRKEKVRLAILGRNYLIDDAALTANIKRYFSNKEVSIVTLEDVPFSLLKENYMKVNGFYDFHRKAKAFIDKVIEEVDGFILVGSFGCHPDAFQIEYFSKYITTLGKSCWTFKFDEQTGGVGFHTRFETIQGFLGKNRDARLEINQNSQEKKKQEFHPLTFHKQPKAPLFIWPNMGAGIDLVIKEVWYQIGLNDYLHPPMPIDESTIYKGNTIYTETCSPFSMYLGSLRQTLDNILDESKANAKKGTKIEPRRIIILMAGGKGPCTFGWYAIAGQKAIVEEYSNSLSQYGHTIEMIAIDNEGRNLLSFLQELSTVANNDKLERLTESLQILESKRVKRINKTKEELKLMKLLKEMVWSGWKKLLAYEDIQNEALKIRAHERKRGMTTRILKKWIQKLDKAHTVEEIYQVRELALTDFDYIEQDNQKKPKVVVVGEIYVALTPFANRGTVDNLLGQLGIEAIEGMRLSHFIKGAFKGLKYHYLHNQQLLSPIFNLLEQKSLYNKNKWVREPLAKPFLEHEIGGDGQPTIAHARYHIENDAVNGILHIYPFKCMPEGIAKDSLLEMSQVYGIKSLHLSFDKETEIERLKTELGTFATLLYQDIECNQAKENWIEREVNRRIDIGKSLDRLYKKGNAHKMLK